MGDKACISFLTGKFKDTDGNPTYLMSAGRHYNKVGGSWRRTEADKKLYLKIKKYLIKKGCSLGDYKNDRMYASYVGVRAKGLVLVVAKDFLVFEK